MDATQGTQTSISNRAYEAFEAKQFTPNSEAGIHISQIKSVAAQLWDVIDGISVPPGNTQAGRLFALAKTELEACVMWATKAVTRLE